MKTILWLAALMVCCGALKAQSGPEIELQCPPGTPIQSGSNDTNWPPLYLQSQWFARTMRVVNTGGAALTIGAQFSVTRTNCNTLMAMWGQTWKTTLGPGEWMYFDIGVQPISPGAWSFTYSLTNNDATGGESPYVVTFSGTAVASNVGVAPTLRMLNQPFATLANGQLMNQPLVEALNAGGARDTSFNGPVTASMFGGAGSAGVLTGTLTVNAVNGLATFSDLGVTLTGTTFSEYNLNFTAPGYANAQSTNFVAESLNPGPPGGSPGSGSSGGGGGGGCSTDSNTGLQCFAGVLAGLALLIRKRLFQRT